MENNQQNKPEPIGIGKILTPVFIGKPQRSILIQILTGLFILTFFYGIWHQRGQKVLAESRYQAGKRDIVVIAPPLWISPHFIDDVLSYRKIKAHSYISITNRDEMEDFYSACAHHPWVRRVESIEVRYPPRILVRLKFRVPTAVVEASPEKYGKEFNGGVFPIDEEGVLLPNDYLSASIKADPGTAYNYIWIAGIQSTPLGGVGEAWNDPAVENAALFAEFLQDNAKRLGIQKIVVISDPSEIAPANTLFELETTRGTKIRWGEFPASAVISARKIPKQAEQYETLKEKLFTSQRAKLEQLSELIRQHGSLDDLPKDKIPVDLSKLDQTEPDEEAPLNKNLL